MKTIKFITGIGLTILLSVTSTQSLAEDVNIVCDACSVIEMEAKAKQELANRIPPQADEGEYYLNVNVIDFYRNTEKTFEVSVDVGYRPVRPRDFSAKKIASSSKFKSDIRRLKTARKKVKEEVESGGIPSSVVSSPWKIPGRSYVVNDIRDYIKSNVKAAIVTTKIQSYASAMGLLKTPLPNVFKVNLDAGGYVEVKIEAASGINFDVTIEKVVDIDNNTLPLKKSDMKNTFYRVSPNAAYIDDLNRLLRSWNLSNNNQFRGTVKIHDLICDDKGCECPDCPEGKN